MIFLLLYKQYNHVIEEVGGGKATRAILRIAEEKRVQKHEKNVGITSFSCYAAEEGELRIVRPSRGSGGFCPGKIFRNFRPLSANFLMENP